MNNPKNPLILNIRDFGATGEGKENDAQFIDRAIEASVKNGGGTVYFPPGVYTCGTIHVKSNVRIFIDRGAIVKLGDDDHVDDIEELTYNPHADMETTYFNCALFKLDNIHNVSIEGGGIIHGNRLKRGGPKPISIKQSQRITIRDITIKNAPNYAISFIDSENIAIDNAFVDSALSDGIDLDGCRFVMISNTRVNSADDGICLKTSPALGELIDCSNIVVTNSIITSACNCFKLGTESSGDFTDIAISNCSFHRRPLDRNPIGGVCIESVDGANINRISASNITMDGINCPVFIRLGNRGRAQKQPTPGTLKNVLISNIVATDASIPCIVAGIPGHAVKNIKLWDILIEYQKRAFEYVKKIPDSIDIPEAEGNYPDPRMFGALPSWGFYTRHVANISVDGLQLITAGVAIDGPACIIDDISRGILSGISIQSDLYEGGKLTSYDF
ncbi:MAG: glycoside hydrolase family 28 protein [Candidatus Hodarchaeota archaeon]